MTVRQKNVPAKNRHIFHEKCIMMMNSLFCHHFSAINDVDIALHGVAYPLSLQVVDLAFSESLFQFYRADTVGFDDEVADNSFACSRIVAFGNRNQAATLTDVDCQRIDRIVESWCFGPYVI